jgi:hypothetical protein
MTQDYKELVSGVAKAAAERPCAYCGEPFTPLWHCKGPSNRKYCYRPNCELAREREKGERARTRLRKQKAKNGIRK